jgi:hypothetical protein
MRNNNELPVTPCNKISANFPIIPISIFLLSINFFQLACYLILRRKNGAIFGAVIGAIAGIGYYFLENRANPGLIQQYKEYVQTPNHLSGNDSEE